MGVIFKREVSADNIEQAIKADLRGPMRTALMEVPTGTSDEVNARAEALTAAAARTTAQLAAHPTTTVRIETKPFLVALGLFFLLLAIAIFLDWKNVVDDPKVYSGMVTTVLGVLIGFLGGDATGTASGH